jgi:hypothetical protein
MPCRPFQDSQDDPDVLVRRPGGIHKWQGQPLIPVRYWFKQAEEAMFWLEVEKALNNLLAA